MASKDPLIGKVIGSYKIIDQLGKGGMGVVYRAQDMALARPVALKFLPQHLADDEEIIKRFGREARASARLNHPNIVTIYGVGRHENLYFIAMELITGKPLDVLIKEKGKFETREALEIIRQSADALAEAHEYGIIHRDIKPQNIMIDDSGRVRVMDFGLALSGFENTKLTATGMTMGTPQYMSPEQWEDSKVDARSDIYSLGITLYEMLAGGPPFDANTPLALMRKVMEDVAPPVSEKNPDVPAKLSEIVARMIAKDIDARYSSAAQLRDDLAAYTGNQRVQLQVSPGTPEQGAGAEDFGSGPVESAGSGLNATLPSMNQQVDAPVPSQPVVQQGQAASAPSGAQISAQQPTGATQATVPLPLPAAEAEEEEPNKLLYIVAGGAGVAVLLVTAVLWFVMNRNAGFSPIIPREDFVYIKAPVEFHMGSPKGEKGRNNDETLHRVTLTKGFYIGKYEVTQAQWEDVMGSNPASFPGMSLPVETVSFNDVQVFIRKLNTEHGGNYRLPTEAEWEYACRAGKETAFCFGDTEALLDNYGWYAGNSDEKTHPVGTKRPNSLGLYDTHGNVSEWVQDWVDAYKSESVIDPTGPAEARLGERKVFRGGNFYVAALKCRSGQRAAVPPDTAEVLAGFRLCVSE